MSYFIGSWVLGKVICSGTGQSEKGRERGWGWGARRTMAQVLVVDKEKGRRGCLAGKRKRARLKRGSWAEGFWAQGFHQGQGFALLGKSHARSALCRFYSDYSALRSLSLPLSGQPCHYCAVYSLCFFLFCVRLVQLTDSVFLLSIANFISLPVFLCIIPNCDCHTHDSLLLSYRLRGPHIAALYP
jgi:hypothetical protein